MRNVWVRLFCGVSVFIILNHLMDFHDPSVDIMILEFASMNKRFDF